MSTATAFSGALRAETIKVTTTRTMTYAIITTAVVALATLAGIMGVFSLTPAEPLFGAAGLTFTAIPIMLVWAAHLFLGELNNGVIRETMRAVPKRPIMFAAKAALAALVTTASVLAIWLVSQAVFAATFGDISVFTYVATGPGLWFAARLSFVVLCWSVIAVAVAALVRNLPVTIGLLLVLYFFLEAYLVEIPGLAYVLPFASGKAIIPEIGQVTLDNMALAAGGQLLITVVLAALAVVMLNRRDLN